MSGYAELFELFKAARDKRGRQGREHILAEVICATLVGVLAACNNAEDVVGFIEDQ